MILFCTDMDAHNSVAGVSYLLCNIGKVYMCM